MLAAAAALVGCGSRGSSACTSPGRSTFVFVATPRSGDHVSSGFGVEGCSSTFEGNVVWTLSGRSGRCSHTATRRAEAGSRGGSGSG
jgi:hypothetical protein